MRSELRFIATAAILCWLTPSAVGDVMAVADPSVASEIGARIRWGGSGFEASLYDASPFGHSPTLNPTGSPVWQLNSPYQFEVSYDSAKGALGLSIDFNRDSTFGAGETISRSTFSLPGMTSYVDYGFRYLSISGSETGSTARSQLTNLTINGTSFSNIVPGGAFAETFFGDSGGAVLGPSIQIAGNLTWLTAGTAQERPSWNFNFRQAEELPLSGSGSGGAAVPEPGSVAMLCAGTLALAMRQLPRLRGSKRQTQRPV